MSIIDVPEQLQAFFKAHKRVGIAFSGGCDSAYLMYAAKRYGAKACGYYVHSEFQPRFELEDAKRLCAELDMQMRVIKLNVLADEQIATNPALRCFYCKRKIFEAILTAAREDGYDCILDGTNASDLASDRPGMRALHELNVLSPLRDCGLQKAKIRALSQSAGLFTWDKPAYACLATRVPTGMRIERELLDKIDRGESALRALGFVDFRLRVSYLGCRIEMREAQLPMMIEKRAAIIAALEKDFNELVLDLRTR